MCSVAESNLRLPWGCDKMTIYVLDYFSKGRNICTSEINHTAGIWTRLGGYIHFLPKNSTAGFIYMLFVLFLKEVFPPVPFTLLCPLCPSVPLPPLCL